MSHPVALNATQFTTIFASSTCESTSNPKNYVNESLLNCITNTTLNRSLKSRGIQTENAAQLDVAQHLLTILQEYFKQETDCISYLQDYLQWCTFINEQKFDQCSQSIVHTICALQPGDKILIPGGYQKNSISMFYEFTKTQVNNDQGTKIFFQLRIGDVGEGLHYHPHVTDDKKTSYLLFIEYKDIPENKLLYGEHQATWFKTLLTLMQSEQSVPYLIYEGLLRPLASFRSNQGFDKKEFWGNPTPYTHNSTDLLSRLIKHYIRLCFTQEQYNEFCWYSKQYCIQYMHNQDVGTQKCQWIYNEIIRSLARTALKAPDSHKNIYKTKLIHLNEQLKIKSKTQEIFTCTQMSVDSNKKKQTYILGWKNRHVPSYKSTQQKLRFFSFEPKITGNTLIQQTQDLLQSLLEIDANVLKKNNRLRYFGCYLIEKCAEHLSLLQGDWKESSKQHLDLLFGLWKWYNENAIKVKTTRSSTTYAVTPRNVQTISILYVISWYNVRSLPPDQFFNVQSLKRNRAELLYQHICKSGPSSRVLEEAQQDARLMCNAKQYKILGEIKKICDATKPELDMASMTIDKKPTYILRNLSYEMQFYQKCVEYSKRHKESRHHFNQDNVKQRRMLQLACTSSDWAQLSPEFLKFRNLIYSMHLTLKKKDIKGATTREYEEFRIKDLEGPYTHAFANNYLDYCDNDLITSNCALWTRNRNQALNDALRSETQPLEKGGLNLEKNVQKLMQILASKSKEPTLHITHNLSLFIDHITLLQHSFVRFICMEQLFKGDEDFNNGIEKEVQNNPNLIAEFLKFKQSLTAISMTNHTNPDIETDLFGFYITLRFCSNIPKDCCNDTEFLSLKERLNREILEKKQELDQWIDNSSSEELDLISTIRAHRLYFYNVMWEEFFKEENDSQLQQRYCEIFSDYFMTCIVPPPNRYCFLEEEIHSFVRDLLPIPSKSLQANVRDWVESILKCIGLSAMISPKAEVFYVPEEMEIGYKNTSSIIAFYFYTGEIFYQGERWEHAKEDLPCNKALYKKLFGTQHYTTFVGENGAHYLQHPGGLFKFYGDRKSINCRITFVPTNQTNEYHVVPNFSDVVQYTQNLPIKLVETSICFADKNEWVFIQNQDYASFEQALRYNNNCLFSPKHKTTYHLYEHEEFLRITQCNDIVYCEKTNSDALLMFMRYHNLIFEKKSNRWGWQLDKNFVLMTQRNWEPLAIKNTLILENDQSQRRLIVPCAPIVCDDQDFTMSVDFDFAPQSQMHYCLYDLLIKNNQIVLDPKDSLLAKLYLAYYRVCVGEYDDALQLIQSIAVSDPLTPQGEEVLSWIYYPPKKGGHSNDRILSPETYALALHAVLLRIYGQELQNVSFNGFDHCVETHIKYVCSLYFRYSHRIPLHLRLTPKQEKKLQSFIPTREGHWRSLRLSGTSINPPYTENSMYDGYSLLKLGNPQEVEDAFDCLHQSLKENLRAVNHLSKPTLGDPCQPFNPIDFISAYTVILEQLHSDSEIEAWIWMKLALTRFSTSLSTYNSSIHQQKLIMILFFVLSARQSASSLPSIRDLSPSSAFNKIHTITKKLQHHFYHMPTFPQSKTKAEEMPIMEQFEKIMKKAHELQQQRPPENTASSSEAYQDYLNQLSQAINSIQEEDQEGEIEFSTFAKPAKKTPTLPPIPSQDYENTQTLQKKMNLSIFSINVQSSHKQITFIPPATFNDEYANYSLCLHQEFDYFQKAFDQAKTWVMHHQNIWDSASSWIQNQPNFHQMKSDIQNFIHDKYVEIEACKQEILKRINQLPDDDVRFHLLQLQGSRTKFTMEQLEQAILNEDMWVVANKMHPNMQEIMSQILPNFVNYEISCIELTQAKQALNYVVEITKESSECKKIFCATQLFAICNNSFPYLSKYSFLPVMQMLILIRRLRMVPRESQLDNIQHLCNFVSIQAMMGDGKSAVCAPFWAFCQSRAGKDEFPMIFISEPLYSSFIDNFKKTQKTVFDAQEVFTIELSINQLNDEKHLQHTLNMLNEGIDQKRVLVMRPEVLQMMHLHLANLLAHCDTTSNVTPKKISLLHSIVNKIYLKGKGLSDEMHDVLNSKNHVVIATGNPEKVPLEEAYLIRRVMGWLVEDSELAHIVGLTENRQGMLDANGWKKVRTQLAKNFFAHDFPQFSDQLKSSFITFMQEKQGTPMPDAVREYYDQCHSDEEQKTIASISFFYALLHNFIVISFRSTPGLHFGRAPHSSAVVPFNGANMPAKKKQIADYIEAVIKCFMTAAQQGIVYDHVRLVGQLISSLGKARNRYMEL